MTERALAQLAELQKIDTALDAAGRDLGEIPAELERQDREMERASRELEGACARLESNIDDQAAVGESKQQAVARIAEYKTSLTTLRTNLEYRAMLTQIDHAEQQIDDLDSRTIELMYAEDELREKLEEARRHHERELDRARKRKDILSRRAVELRQELESLERKREALASEINIRFLRKYEQLRASGKAEAVVGLSNGNCGGCLTVVPPQNALEIRQGILYHCPICGRFIVWSEDSSLARKS